MTEGVSSEEGNRILGRDAQRNNILAARVIAETVKTTLGPKGMDKMLVDRVGNVTVTNDGVTILEEMDIEHPAAKMVVEVAKTQEAEVGDGTTTAVMIAGKLLEHAEFLLDKKIHPTTIIRGYRWASEKTQELLGTLAVDIETEEELSKVAQTAMTGKGAEHLREQFADIIVEAVKSLAQKGVHDVKSIRIEKKKGGSLEDTELIKGIVLDKEKLSVDMPVRVEQATIALIEESLGVRNPELEAKLSVSSPEQLQGFLSQEDALLKAKVDTIKKSGANVLFAQRGIDSLVKHYLAKHGIYAVSQVGAQDLQALAHATGAKVVSRLSDMASSDLGYAKVVEEKSRGEEALTYITGCENPKALTILVRGGSDHVVDEVERAFQDALGDVAATMKDSKVVAGGGAIEVELSRKLKEYALGLTGRERLAVEEFANSLECIPTTLAENAGMDPIDVITELRGAHDAGNIHHGLNLFSGVVEDTLKEGIIEPLKVKQQAISSASEVATMILRIDDVIAAKKSGGRGGNLGMMSGYD